MLKLAGVTLYRGSLCLLEKVAIEANKGQRIGIVGRNGTGKTSLLSLIQGDLLADSGDLSFPSDWLLSHVSQSIEEGDRSALDYVLDGDEAYRRSEKNLTHAQSVNDPDAIAEAHEKMREIDGYTATARAGRLLHGLGISAEDFDKTVSNFSGGWQMRLNLARALMMQSDILLLDEPTNHLDLDAIAWLERWLASYRGVLLVVSHDRDFLDAVANRIWHIESQRLTAYKGNYAEFETLRVAKMIQLAAAAKHQADMRANIQRFIDRFRAKATKAKQVQSRIKALERLAETAIMAEEKTYAIEFLPPLRQADPLVILEDISAGYGDRVLLSHVNLTIGSGQRIAILGRNGAGKSTFMKVLAGDLTPLNGKRMLSPHLKIGYLAQGQLDAFRDNDTALHYFLRENPEAKEQEARNFLGRFGFGDRFNQAVSSFSGGEKTRLALASIIWQRPNLLLLDEPTNHLDLAMREAIVLALQDFEGAVVLVSHDRHLLKHTADQLLVVYQNTLMPFEDDLLAYQKWLLAEERDQTVIQKAKEPVENRKEKRRAEAEARARLHERRRPLEQKILAIEKEMGELSRIKKHFDEQLGNPSFYEKVEKAELQAILQEQANVEQRLSALEESWLDLQTQCDKLD